MCITGYAQLPCHVVAIVAAEVVACKLESCQDMAILCYIAKVELGSTQEFRSVVVEYVTAADAPECRRLISALA